jgi:ribosome biogenesis protein BMS1
LLQAFIFASAARSKREKTRKAEKEQRRLHVPVDERPVDEPPPIVVLVHGPPQARGSPFRFTLLA